MHDGPRVLERELHRLDLRVQARVEAVVESEGEERCDALPVRRQLAHLDPPVVRTAAARPTRSGAPPGPPRRASTRPRSPTRPGPRTARQGLRPRSDAGLRRDPAGRSVCADARRGPRRALGCGPLVPDARGADDSARGGIGRGAQGRVETGRAETLREVGPEPYRAGHRDRGRAVLGCGAAAELCRRAARAVDPVEPLAVPDDRERVTAHAVVRRARTP